MTIRVVLADDQQLIRAGLHGLLSNSDDIDVVGQAGDGIEAVDVVRRTRPDIVLMDIRMPRMDGVTATGRIVADPVTAGTKVLVLTTFDEDEHVYRALRAGASGFLTKDAEPEELRRAVRVVAAGDSLLAPAITRRLIAAFMAQHAPQSVDNGMLARLTDREREVMALAAQGLSNEEIGLRLHLSPATARTHVSRAMGKLGARDRTQLVVLAYQTGLVRP